MKLGTTKKTVVNITSVLSVRYTHYYTQTQMKLNPFSQKRLIV